MVKTGHNDEWDSPDSVCLIIMWSNKEGSKTTVHHTLYNSATMGQ